MSPRAQVSAKTKVLAIDLLRIDGDTQNRIEINQDVVDDYLDIIVQNGKEWPFPPLVVFHDGSDYWISDGFHRWLAAQTAKRGSIPCDVRHGTAKDARIFGMTANDQHGLRMSRADKRACVEWLLDNGGKMTQKKIAELAGVCVRTVQVIVAERKPTPIKWTGKSKVDLGGTAITSSNQKAQTAPNTPSGGGKGSGSRSKGSGGPTTEEPPVEPSDTQTDAQEPETVDPKELAKKNRDLAHKYRDNLARAVCDYHEVKPNRSERDRIVKVVQGIELWK